MKEEIKDIHVACACGCDSAVDFRKREKTIVVADGKSAAFIKVNLSDARRLRDWLNAVLDDQTKEER